MRALLGIAIDGRVIEMGVPDDVALAHLMPEILHAAQCCGRGPRRATGEWLDLERTLADQGFAPGGLICLEAASPADVVVHHDPAVAWADRSPPVQLVPPCAVLAVIGATVGAALAALGPAVAVVMTAAVPLGCALLPLGAGLASERTVVRVQRALVAVAIACGAAAVAASGRVAQIGPFGLLLDGAVGGAVVAHVFRARLSDPLARVVLGGCEWWLLGTIAPLALLAAGWRL